MWRMNFSIGKFWVLRNYNRWVKPYQRQLIINISNQLNVTNQPSQNTKSRSRDIKTVGEKFKKHRAIDFVFINFRFRCRLSLATYLMIKKRENVFPFSWLGRGLRLESLVSMFALSLGFTVYGKCTGDAFSTLFFHGRTLEKQDLNVWSDNGASDYAWWFGSAKYPWSFRLLIKKRFETLERAWVDTWKKVHFYSKVYGKRSKNFHYVRFCKLFKQK